ncbi:hypothetical protein AMS68_007044 [Peltaster fructicola]|uniref:PUM-HD domain-containing protein n=1 Tax=Peltaster fructicola TaxID=286661 RepID=A0A6H0Y3E2_9PEZI|nr:hypothetical protein AMS68_007044 [Peltaster fructicola]
MAATLGNGTGPWGKKTSSIWGSNSSTFVPRAVADKPHPRNLSVETTDIKKGSGSLLASSESDHWRPGQARGDSAVRISTQPFRGASTVEVPRSLSGGSSNISPTASRAPTVNLTNTAFSAQRPSFTSPTNSGFFGGEPPNVYPKYRDRQAYPSDTVISPTTSSPINERRAQWPTQYHESASVTTSRDTSRAPQSSHSDRQFSFHVDQRSQRRTPQTARNPSQSNISYNNMSTVNPDFLPVFGQVAPDRSVSRGVPSYNRTTYLEQVDDTDRWTLPGYNNFTSSLYSTPTTPSNFTFTRMQDPQALEFRPGHHFHPRTQSEEFVPMKQSWQENDMVVAQRPAHHPMVDTRVAAQVMALKEQYNLYNPYTIPPLHSVGPYLSYYHMGLGNLSAAPPTGPSELESGLQSAKLYDFKQAGKNNRRYELKDIYEHIAEFAGDQHGSRFIQNKLETANSDEKERVFREIEPNAIPLMTDVFGNYVIQKFFDHGHQEHKKILAHKMRGQVLNLSTQMYGCRVVQKALEHVLLEQQAALVGELRNHITACIKDQNGNHVIQKAIERCPASSIGFVYQALVAQVHTLSLHPYGCRVIQRCLERQEEFPAKEIILGELHESMSKGMIGDSYGNYVVQHVVENGPDVNRQHVLNIVLADLEGYSKHKFASNVVEKCIQYSTDVWRRKVVEVLTTVDDRRAEGEGVLVSLIKDSFGNYVIQKLLDSLLVQDFMYLCQHLQPAMAHTKRTGCGKQVVSIEKKMARCEGLVHHSATYGLPVQPVAFQSNYGSVSNTPALTADSRSMQSSGLPSVNGDAVEGATMSRKNSEAPVEALTR